MRYISLPALKVALAELFDKRLVPLRASSSGKTYEPILVEKKTRIDALPIAFTGGKPLADALSDVDRDHDGFGRAIWYLTEAYLRWPNVSPELRAAIERIRAAFIPDLDILRVPYIEEVDAAHQHKQDLVTLEADLKSIPIAGGVTLYDWCVGYIGKGEELGTLLAQRADLSAKKRVEAGKLRSATLGILGRLRAAIADEMSVNSNLPADLDAQVFSYFDELDKMGASAAAARNKTAEAPPAEPTP